MRWNRWRTICAAWGLTTIMLMLMMVTMTAATPALAVPDRRPQPVALDVTPPGDPLARLQGIYELCTEEMPERGRSSEFPVLLTQDGRWIRLVQRDDPRANQHGLEGAAPGEPIRVDGRWLGPQRFRVVRHAASGASSRLPARVAALPGRGIRRVLVLVVDFSDTTIRDDCLDGIHDAILNPETASANRLYTEASDGRMRLSGAVHGIFDLDLAATCDVARVARAAIEHVDPFVDFRLGYSSIVLIAPFPDRCRWTGVASGVVFDTDDSPEPLYTKLSAIKSWAGTNAFVAAHELGHNIGLGHANLLDCGLVSFEPPCPKREYQDPYSVMGRPHLAHLNAPQQEHLGWFTADNLQLVDSTGTFELHALESLEPRALKALKIPLAATSPYAALYLEWRQPLGLDSVLAAYGNDVFEGLLLHTMQRPVYPQTFLIDATPPTHSFTPALREHFFEPATFTFIRVLSKSAAAPDILPLEIVRRRDFVRIVEPTGGALVSGVIGVEAQVHAPEAIRHLELYLDGDIQAFARFEQPPFRTLLRTSTLAEGLHHLRARVHVENRLSQSMYGDSDALAFVVQRGARGRTGRESRERLRLLCTNPIAGRNEVAVVVPDGSAAASGARLTLFDVGGRVARSLHDGPLASGTHIFDVDRIGARGTPLPSGVYFARLRAGARRVTRKLIVVD